MRSRLENFLKFVNNNVFQPTSLAVCYWKPKEKKDSHLVNEEHMPVLIVKDLEKHEEYLGLPDVDYPGHLKVC